MAPSGYCLFQNLAFHLPGARFRYDADFLFLPVGIGFPTKSKSKTSKDDRTALIIQLTKVYTVQKRRNFELYRKIQSSRNLLTSARVCPSSSES